MLSKKLLLILGAGASMPYKFPSGRELTERIIYDLTRREYIYTLIDCNSDFSEQYIAEFRSALIYSSRYSIDAFLEDRPEYKTIGKLCIVQTLLPYESNEKLWQHEGGDWYRYLYNTLDFKLGDYHNNHNLRVITFNYDRSFEQFLLTSILFSFPNMSMEKSAALVREIPIIHLHGMLGGLPQLHGQGIDYGAKPNAQKLKECAANIRIISEDIEKSDELRKAQLHVQEAEIICFLGFSYHRMNMARLFPRDAKILARIFGTSQGIEVSRIGEIKLWFRSAPELQPYDCLQAFHNWDILY